MLAEIGPTLDTTYALQLRHDDGWHFTSQAEYTDVDDCRAQVTQMYGGAFAAADQHRVVEIQRVVLD